MSITVVEVGKPTATEPPINPHVPFVTVSQGMRGWFAVIMWWNPDLGGFWEPWQTADQSSPFKDIAIRDAKNWAATEQLAFYEGLQ